MNLEQALVVAVFAVKAIWFLSRNRNELDGSAAVRHIIFTIFTCVGCLSLFYGAPVFERWIFGKVIHKGDPQEPIAGVLPFLVCIFFFALAAISLGKDRVRHFKLYLNTFGLNAFLGKSSGADSRHDREDANAPKSTDAPK